MSRILVSTPRPDARDALQKHQQQVLEELNVKAVEFIASDAGLVSYEVTPDFPRLGKRHGKLMPAIKSALAGADGNEILNELEKNGRYDLDVEGQTISLEPDDVHIKTSSAEGYVCSGGDGYMVALDTSLADDLVIEGLARELIRTIQDGRKSAGLDISDRISVAIEGSTAIQQAIETHREYIMSETLALELVAQMDDGFQASHDLGEDDWNITLKKQADN